VDFHELEKRLDSILGAFNNRHLNEVAAFSRLNPSAENVAFAVARALDVPGEAILLSVEVTEAPGCVAVFKP